MTKTEIISCLEGVPTKKEGRSQIDDTKRSAMFEALSKEFGIPPECFDVRAISELNATTRSAYETTGKRLVASKAHALPEWVFFGRVGVEKAQLNSIADSMKSQLDGKCSIAVLFAKEMGWNAYRIFYSSGKEKLGERFAAYFGVPEDNRSAIGPMVPMGVNVPAINPPVATMTPHSASGLAGLVEQFAGCCSGAQLVIQPAAVNCFASSLLSKRFLILTGLAGSGKTKLAQAFARWITPIAASADAFRAGAKIESDRVVYYVNSSDSLAVEFWNKEDKEEATKVTLPRAMIREWANYIQANGLTSETPARAIREAVKITSKFSDQLHSFETHLKAAALALITAQDAKSSVKCHDVVPVGADWTGNENILGYPDGLKETNYVAKPALDLILHADNHPDAPHFLILDEMNLSHVERYFADFLSVIESEEGLELYSGDMEKQETWRKTSASIPVPPRLKQLPPNLFIVGTVNVDETTYMFSPKVLDRANVIEFRMDAGELEGYLGNPAKPDLSKLDGKGAAFGKAFVDAAKCAVAVPADVKAAYDAEMLLLFKTLQAHGAEFGYRTAYETARFIHYYKLLGNHADGDSTWFHGAFDCVILQKILPKLHGSRAKLGPILKMLWFLCVNEPAGRGADAIESARKAASSTDKQHEPSKDVPDGAQYPLSAEKIGRMWRLLIENGFASFAEA